MLEIPDRVTAIYVGSDEELSAQVRSSIESIPGWQVQRVIDVDTAVTLATEHTTAAIVLYISDEYSFAQSLKLMRMLNCDTIAVVVIYDRLKAEQLLQLYRNGAAECLGRPVNLSRLTLVLEMFRTPQAAGVSKSAATVASGVSTNGGELAPASEYQQMMDQVHSVASLNTTVLITGETGSGKTRLSRLIHGLSPRKHKPFLALNCGALSESLIDTELFGHVKGAFTGADRDYEGKLAQCRDGTLLLDEVDTLSPVAQVKLLQVVEDRVFQPVGSAKFEPLQARLIVASNKSLQQEVDEGRFRSDLFYRLNVMSFELLPLRERRPEILTLASRFMVEFAEQHGRSVAKIDARAVDCLEKYAWPGNIRELRNVMERAVILAGDDMIGAAHLPGHIAQTTGPAESGIGRSEDTVAGNRLARARMEAEKEQLQASLQRNGNNRSKTAHELGISRVTLYKRLRKLRLL